MGAGRKSKKDNINLSVGLVLNKKIGDYVHIGDELVTIYANSTEEAEQAEKQLIKTLKIGEKKIIENTIIDIIK